MCKEIYFLRYLVIMVSALFVYCLYLHIIIRAVPGYMAACVPVCMAAPRITLKKTTLIFNVYYYTQGIKPGKKSVFG